MQEYMVKCVPCVLEVGRDCGMINGQEPCGALGPSRSRGEAGWLWNQFGSLPV